MKDREVTAERLLRSSLEHAFEPRRDIDWDAPLDPNGWGMPAHRVSLYGTSLWDELSEEQRRTLSIHELCSITRLGIWLETILMQMLARYAYEHDPRRKHIQFALTELAEECRHSIMFARMIERYGTPEYAPKGVILHLGRVFGALGSGPAMLAATLFVEEVLDQMQREAMRDETVQPLTRAVNKIHVIEEARHVRWAREELTRIMPETTPAQRVVARHLTAQVAFTIARNFIHPDVYRSVGLDPQRGREAALANPHHHEMLRWSTSKLVPFLRERGLIGGPSQLLWRRAHLL